MTRRSYLRSFLKFLLLLFLLIILVILSFIGTIFINSGNSETPIVDENGSVIENSVSMILDTVINGANQRLTIRGYDLDNPVLLKVHGGPGSHFIHPWARSEELEKRFIVCYWDQRGNGPAYTPDIPDESLNLDQIVDDGIEVSRFLSDHFNKKRIYLHGHSWGTAVSSHMAKEAPELFNAYIGIGQMADQPRSEEMSFKFVLKEARSRNDSSSLASLATIGPPPYETKAEMVNAVKIERRVVNKYSTFRGKGPQSNFTDIMKDLLFYPGLTFGDKTGFLKGKKYNDKAFNNLWPDCAKVNLIRDIKGLDVPVFIIQGKEDHYTETILAREYFDSLKAPLKKWYLFENSTHRPDVEEPERYMSVMDSILELTL